MSSFWAGLNGRRQLFAVLAAVVVFGAVLMLARGAATKDMSLLFGGLEARAAGDVVTALDQRGVVYEVRGSSIYVPTTMRDSLRMSLAGEGLPLTGSQGYELLDSLSGFSTTSQMFDAAYWRAKEGELARTILASPHIRAARVHISTQTNRPFQREQNPTAAVTVTTAGGSLATPNIKALQFLVGAAVPGLAPDAVTIIDDSGGLLSDPDGQNLAVGADERANNLRLRAERLLAARVGVGNAVVEVSVDTVTETETITERRVDPDSRVAISTEVTESTGTSSDSRAGDVTVASNLPDGDANAGNTASSNESAESRALTNYEVSETQRQLLRAPGAVRRLTVAVLINDVTRVEADGTTITVPRSVEELAALEELVSSAIGIDPARGDIITLRSLPFEPIAALGTEAGNIAAATSLDLMQLIQIGVLAVVALILGLFVVRPILTQQSALVTKDDTMALPHPDVSPSPIKVVDEVAKSPAEDHPPEDPVKRLRNLIADRETETMQILQDWIEEPSQKERV